VGFGCCAGFELGDWSVDVCCSWAFWLCGCLSRLFVGVLLLFGSYCDGVEERVAGW